MSANLSNLLGLLYFPVPPNAASASRVTTLYRALGGHRIVKEPKTECIVQCVYQITKSTTCG